MKAHRWGRVVGAAVTALGLSTVSLSAVNAAPASAASSPILLGGIYTEIDLGQGFATGILARIDQQNKAGGVAGHQLKLVKAYDAGQSQTTAFADLQHLVLQNHVLGVIEATAVIDQSDVLFASTHQTLEAGYSFLPNQCGSHWWLPVISGGCIENPHTTFTDEGANLQGYAKATGKSLKGLRVAVFGQKLAGTLPVHFLGDAARYLGSNVVYDTASIPLTPQPTNYTPYIQPILAAKPQLIIGALGGPELLGMIQASEQAGYTGTWISGVGPTPGLFTEQPTEAAILNGVYQAQVFPASVDNTPASKQEETALKAIGAFNDTFSFSENIAYWATDQVISMLQAAAKSGSVTATAVEKLVNSGKYTYHGPKGYYASQTWPASETHPTGSCIELTKVDTPAKKFVSSLPLTCWPVINTAGTASSG